MPVYGVTHERAGRRGDRPGVRQQHLDGRHRRVVERMHAPAVNCTHAFRIRLLPLLWFCQLCGAAETHEAIGCPQSVVVARLRLLKRMAARFTPNSLETP